MEERIKYPGAYQEFHNVFEGITITMRNYFKDDVVLIKLDDNFAKANGFRTMTEIHALSPSLIGYEWLDVKLIEQAGAFMSKPVN